MTILTPLLNQKGAFSPFMFGLLMGVTLLSGVMQHWAKKELERIEGQQSELAQEKADDMKLAVENMILTENVESGEGYGTFFSADALKAHLTNSTGQTRSGDTLDVSSYNRTGNFGETGQRLVITSSDDAFERQKIREQGMEAGAENKEDGLAVIDTTDIRQKQIVQSKEYLEMEASQLFRSYISGGYEFPETSAYKDFNRNTGLKDSWGQSFKYERKTPKKAVLSFTTPWGYTFKKSLSME